MERASSASGGAGRPRIAPGGAHELGRLNHTIALLAGLPLGGGRPNIMTTLGRHRRLFRRWLGFAAALMPGGVLPRAETELVILRVAHNAGSDYEWRHHEQLGELVGLSSEEIERVREGPEADGWSARQAALMRAADELHERRTLGEATWAELRPLYSDKEIIELCLLVGHYEMVAMTLNALAVEPDPQTGPPGRLGRTVQRLVSRRSRRKAGSQASEPAPGRG